MSQVNSCLRGERQAGTRSLLAGAAGRTRVTVPMTGAQPRSTPRLLPQSVTCPRGIGAQTGRYANSELGRADLHQ